MTLYIVCRCGREQREVARETGRVCVCFRACSLVYVYLGTCNNKKIFLPLRWNILFIFIYIHMYMLFIITLYFVKTNNNTTHTHTRTHPLSFPSFSPLWGCTKSRLFGKKQKKARIKKKNYATGNQIPCTPGRQCQQNKRWLWSTVNTRLRHAPIAVLESESRLDRTWDKDNSNCAHPCYCWCFSSCMSEDRK